MRSIKSGNAWTLIVILFIDCQASSTIFTRITETWSLKDLISENQQNLLRKIKCKGMHIYNKREVRNWEDLHVKNILLLCGDIKKKTHKYAVS